METILISITLRNYCQNHHNYNIGILYQNIRYIHLMLLNIKVIKQEQEAWLASK